MGVRLKKLKEQVMVLTGASSGIGLVTAIPILNLILAAALFSGAGFTFVLVMTWVGYPCATQSWPML